MGQPVVTCGHMEGMKWTQGWAVRDTKDGMFFCHVTEGVLARKNSQVCVNSNKWRTQQGPAQNTGAIVKGEELVSRLCPLFRMGGM